MKLVMTVMVRDEIDIIAAMIEHHLAQGVDLIIATDNGSVDGTAEVLQRYADLGVLELHHDPVFRKQQHAVVTGMARRAATEHGADWVVNADADEFWAPVDKRLSLHEALDAIPVSLNAFTAPVTNLVGPPAVRGSGIDRLVWRDHRTQEQLNAVGIYAQPTPDAVHRGDPDVVVAQGNHFVSLESKGQPEPAYALEVLHLPWRSWSQLEQKVVHAGRAYEANPNLKPSKNHHGMADYRRYQAGRLEYAFLLRQPLERDLVAGEADGVFQRDTWLRDEIHDLAPRARIPELLAACLDGSADEPFDPARHESDADIGRMFVELERERDEALRDKDRKTATKPPRIRDEWIRLSRRTAGAMRRRAGRTIRRRR
jgi:glycosyl transferase family 2